MINNSYKIHDLVKHDANRKNTHSPAVDHGNSKKDIFSPCRFKFESKTIWPIENTKNTNNKDTKNKDLCSSPWRAAEDAGW